MLPYIYVLPISDKLRTFKSNFISITNFTESKYKIQPNFLQNVWRNRPEKPIRPVSGLSLLVLNRKNRGKNPKKPNNNNIKTNKIYQLRVG